MQKSVGGGVGVRIAAAEGRGMGKFTVFLAEFVVEVGSVAK